MKQILPYFFTALAVFGEPPIQKKVTLEYRFQPGKTYVYAQEMKMGMEMNNPATQDKVKIVTEMEQDFTFTAIEHEKGVKVEMVFDKISMKSGAGGVTMMEFDSSVEGNETNPIAKMMEPMLAMTCYSIYDESGKPIEFGGLEELPEMKQLGIDPKQLEKSFNQAYEMMPAEPVAVGDSWKVTQVIPMGKMGGDIEIAMVNTLEGIEELNGHKVAKISYVADMEMTMNLGEKSEATSISVEIKKFQGAYWHDLNLNMTRKSTLSSSMIIGAPKGTEVGANGMGDIPYDMEMVQVLKEVK